MNNGGKDNNFTNASVNPSHNSAPAPDPAPAPNPTPSGTQNNDPPMSNGEGSFDDEAKGDGNTLEIWSSAKANRRTKERKISFVIEKVSMWRKLYNGIQDNQGKIVRYR